MSGDIKDVFQELVAMEAQFQRLMQEEFAQYREPGYAQDMLELRAAICQELWRAALKWIKAFMERSSLCPDQYWLQLDLPIPFREEHSQEGKTDGAE